jgi:hypothetical protein
VDFTFSLIRSGRGTTCFRQGIPEDPVQLLAYFRSRTVPRFHFNEDATEQICSALGLDQKKRTIAAAEDIVRRRFTFRGVEPITLDPVDWRIRPNDSIGWTWDLNRHFYFATLGFAYWYTKDPRFARAFLDLSSSWIECNIENLGRIKWDHPFEVGARINGWIWAYFLFLNCPDWKASVHHTFLCALERLSEYLYQTIEYHNPGNHILLEAKALALCAELFPEFKGARRWGAKAWRILRRELKAQICPDGVHCERSTMYHRIVAGELSELWLFCLRNDLSQQGMLGESVKRMADFQTWIDQGSGNLPLFGDSHEEDSYYRFSAPFIVAVLKGGSVLPGLLDMNDHNWWILHSQAPNSPSSAKPDVSQTSASKAFPVGGYFVSRTGWEGGPNVLVWDCGPMGYHANRKHAHLDALAFTLSVKGVPLLIDQGTESKKRKQPLRSTRAHNTVCVDGEEQGILAERGEIWKAPNPRVLLWAASPECDVMAGCHDGYGRLSKPVQHTRTIVAMHHRYWLILDRLEGRGCHEAEQRFHMAPRAGIEWVFPQRCAVVKKDHAKLSISLIDFSDGRIDKSFRAGIGREIAELSFGRPVEIDVITATRAGQVPFSLGVVVTPGERGIEVEVISSETQDGLEIVEVRGSEFRDRVCVSHGEGAVRELLGGWKTDARVVVFRYCSTGGGIKSIIVAGGSTLTNDDESSSFSWKNPDEGSPYARVRLVSLSSE